MFYIREDTGHHARGRGYTGRCEGHAVNACGAATRRPEHDKDNLDNCQCRRDGLAEHDAVNGTNSGLQTDAMGLDGDRTYRLYMPSLGGFYFDRCLVDVRKSDWRGEEKHKGGKNNENRLFKDNGKVKTGTTFAADNRPKSSIGRRQTRRGRRIHGDGSAVVSATLRGGRGKQKQRGTGAWDSGGFIEWCHFVPGIRLAPRYRSCGVSCTGNRIGSYRRTARGRLLCIETVSGKIAFTYGNTANIDAFITSSV